MRYLDLLNKAKESPLFRVRDISSGKRVLPHELVQFNRWVKAGKLIRLKRGIYTTAETDWRAELSPLWLSNQLYWPSCISLEYALSFYGIIPEAVGPITAITPLKTARIQNELGTFIYRTVSKELFFGFKTLRTPRGQFYWMADPEKALLDFCYFISRKNSLTEKGFMDNLRLQNLPLLRIGALKSYAAKFHSVAMTKIGARLVELTRKEKR